MSILIERGENVIQTDGTVTKRVVLLSGEKPASLEITGADVEGLNDDDVIAAGSKLTTPTAKYTAFEGGKFTQVSSGSGGGGGADLPAVTTDDNGKVLSVVNGEWDKANAPKELPSVSNGDNGKVLSVVNGTWAKADPQGGALLVQGAYSNQIITLNKTFGEIATAYTSGKPVIISVSVDQGGGYTREMNLGVISLSINIFDESTSNPESDSVEYQGYIAAFFPSENMGISFYTIPVYTREDLNDQFPVGSF